MELSSPLYKILTHGNTKSTQSFEVLITKLLALSTENILVLKAIQHPHLAQ